MATTTNYGWETPDDTDLVKDGASAMRTLGQSIDTTFAELKGGTTGQMLTKASNTDNDYTWVTPEIGDITAVNAGTGLSGGGTTGSVTLSIDSTVATLTGSQTLTNKTLTSPVIASISNTGTITLPTSSDTLVGRATTDTLTNKTLTSPRETTTVSATAATGTINFDVLTQGVLIYTTNASANWTLNVRGSSGTTLNTLMATGETVTVAFVAAQGTTAYYASGFTIDGTSVTPKWQGGTAPTAGNASADDAYTYAITKTGANAYRVYASQTKFA